VSRHFRQRNGEEQRATWFELFFDLVYVFAVTQISTYLLAHYTWRGAFEALVLLLVVWWAWIYTTWMANWFDPDAVPVRLVLVGVMLLSLLMSVSIPTAFGANGLLFAASYATLQVFRNGFNVAVAERGSTWRDSFTRILAWSILVAPIWIAGGLVEGRARLLVWLVALGLDYLGPAVRYWTPRHGKSPVGDWSIEGAHFAERFQLFIIIALGESIAVTGATASHTGVSALVVAALSVAFVSSIALWWLYFDRVAMHAQTRMLAAPDRERLGRDAYTYLHIPIVAGNHHRRARRRDRDRPPHARRGRLGRARDRRRAGPVPDRPPALPAAHDGHYERRPLDRDRGSAGDRGARRCAGTARPRDRPDGRACAARRLRDARAAGRDAAPRLRRMTP
jgi:low temperature requirement protein LtrA